MTKIREIFRKNFTPPMVVALAALIVALSGTAYAATQLSRNSVGSSQIKAGAVKTTKLASNVQAKLNKVGARGPKGEQGERGSQGVPGQNGMNGTNGLPGQDGTVDFAGVYEISANRTGSGVVNAQCNGNDQAISSFWYASSTAMSTMASRGNGGRQYSYDFSTPSGSTVSTVVVTCAPN